MYKEKLEQVKERAQNYFTENPDPNLIYHNRHRTQTVVEWAMQIAGHYKLDSKSLFIMQTALWLHDIGYFENLAHPEKKGARLTEDLLQKIQIGEELIESIKSSISASIIPQKAQNLTEQIVCDACMFHLGSKDFALISKMMQKERTLITGKKISKEEGKQRNIELLQNHRFKTDYAKQLFDNQQKKNLEEMLSRYRGPDMPSLQVPQDKIQIQASSKQNDQLLPVMDKHNVPSQILQNRGHSSDKQAKNKKRPNRGIETMFRISSNNHQALSQMADNKAHIMITVNSIIISVLLSVLIRSLDNEPHLAIPVAILLMVNVITIIYSILATRPNIPPGKFSEDDLDQQKVNLLFFGNFYKMPLDDFSEGMTRLMENRNFLYSSLIVNLHQQGLVLGRKYKYLRISYNIFMFGLVISLIAFGIAIFIKRM